ncbi:MAG: shikimate kinase [Desulfopila sp.]|nr:shikimate kinase [Desulfopila sp.]
MKNNIVLIGFMGVGKGQIARKIASRTSYYAVDCDDLIESLVNIKIKKIFRDSGEEEFRKLEKRTARWLEKNVSETVISTGGGFVNVKNLHKIGSIVYLHADFDYIIQRIVSHPNAARKIKKRPLLKSVKDAEKLYAARLPLYKKVADVTVDVTGKSVDEIASEICSLYQLIEN